MPTRTYHPPDKPFHRAPFIEVLFCTLTPDCQRPAVAQYGVTRPCEERIEGFVCAVCRPALIAKMYEACGRPAPPPRPPQHPVDAIESVARLIAEREGLDVDEDSFREARTYVDALVDPAQHMDDELIDAARAVLVAYERDVRMFRSGDTGYIGQGLEQFRAMHRLDDLFRLRARAHPECETWHVLPAPGDAH